MFQLRTPVGQGSWAPAPEHTIAKVCQCGSAPETKRLHSTCRSAIKALTMAATAILLHILKRNELTRLVDDLSDTAVHCKLCANKCISLQSCFINSLDGVSKASPNNAPKGISKTSWYCLART